MSGHNNRKQYFTMKSWRPESTKINPLQMSNSSQMPGTHENTSLLCGSDPVYYTSTLGIVVDWVIFLVGLPEVCLACYALLCLLKKDRAAPIFAINLLLSDLVQIGTTVVFIMSRFFDASFYPFARARCIARLFVHLGLTSSLGFMMLISAERYLLVACPVWYHTKNSTRLSLLISVSMWTFSLVYSSLDNVFLIHTRFSLLLFSIICLLPTPFLLGFFAATWGALNKSTAMRRGSKNRRRVLGVLTLVLGTYMVLFFPFCFRNFYYSVKGDSEEEEDSVRDFSGILTSALVYLSPLMDGLLYIFIRKDVTDTVEAFPCCRTPLMKLREFQERTTDTSQMETAF